MRSTTTTLQPEHHLVVLRQPEGELSGRERWQLMRHGRWQGAMAVLLLLIFWRFLFVLAAFGVGVTVARRLAGRGGDRRRELDGEAETRPVFGEADAAHAVLEEAEARAHQDALDDFDRRLMRSLATGVEEPRAVQSREEVSALSA